MTRRKKKKNSNTIAHSWHLIEELITKTHKYYNFMCTSVATCFSILNVGKLPGSIQTHKESRSPQYNSLSNSAGNCGIYNWVVCLLLYLQLICWRLRVPWTLSSLYYSPISFFLFLLRTRFFCRRFCSELFAIDRMCTTYLPFVWKRCHCKLSYCFTEDLHEIGFIQIKLQWTEYLAYSLKFTNQ